MRLVCIQAKLYYEVVDLRTNVQESFQLASIDYGQEFYYRLIHDRRLYGKSLFYFGVDKELDLTFEIPYPSIPEHEVLTELSFMENTCGSFSSIFLFTDPLEPALLKEYFDVLPKGVLKKTDFAVFQTHFKLIFRAIGCFVSRYNLFNEGDSTFSCPFTRNTFVYDPAIIKKVRIKNSTQISDSLDSEMLISLLVISSKIGF